MQFRNAVPRILKLRSCERVDWVSTQGQRQLRLGLLYEKEPASLFTFKGKVKRG